VRLELKTELAVVVSQVEAEAESSDGRDVFMPCPPSVRDVILDYAVMLCLGLGRARTRNEASWKERLLPILEPLLGTGDIDDLVGRLCEIGGRLSMAANGEAGRKLEPGDGSDGEGVGVGIRDRLCDCTLTLACGAATLLSGARLCLARSRVYGLVGANDSGKSTLLRAIHERRVVGFPPAGELITALVEHGVGERPPECDRTALEYLLADPALQVLGLPESEIMAALRSLGFFEGGRLNQPIRMLSGGWRMKLGLARAMLQSADVLLLDEPTGHLDVDHITWLVDYINNLKEDKLRLVTTLVVSHDAPFLDRVCTHVIHLQDANLRTYRGNFSRFLEKVPDAQLGTAPPEPGALEGVRSRGRRFLNLEDVYYTYPGAAGPAVRRASVECSLRSRVAIMGPNGAGKSTLAGLVVGELAPDIGTAWRHPNLRVAFVAQHAFHHLEQRMDLSATQYILWRFEGNEDREAMEFRAEEEEACSEPRSYSLRNGGLVPCDPEDEEAVQAEVIVDRRQRGRLGYEYEVRWCGIAETTWLSRKQLGAMGCLGMAKREDERQAAQRALSERPLTTPAVEAHLAGFGLEAEEASHRRLGALSYGQRARAVLAAATWLAPHLLVLDEPTNYLDRPALAALTAGLRGFGGGVLVISHTAAFLDEVCTERWVMRSGVLRREGLLPTAAEEGATAEEAAGVGGGGSGSGVGGGSNGSCVGGSRGGGGGLGPRVVATSGSSSTATALKEARERKKQKRLKEIRRKKGEQVSSDEDLWYEDLLKKANPKTLGA